MGNSTMKNKANNTILGMTSDNSQASFIQSQCILKAMNWEIRDSKPMHKAM